MSYKKIYHWTIPGDIDDFYMKLASNAEDMSQISYEWNAGSLYRYGYCYKKIPNSRFQLWSSMSMRGRIFFHPHLLPLILLNGSVFLKGDTCHVIGKIGISLFAKIMFYAFSLAGSLLMIDCFYREYIIAQKAFVPYLTIPGLLIFLALPSVLFSLIHLFNASSLKTKMDKITGVTGIPKN